LKRCPAEKVLLSTRVLALLLVGCRPEALIMSTRIVTIPKVCDVSWCAIRRGLSPSGTLLMMCIFEFPSNVPNNPNVMVLFVDNAKLEKVFFSNCFKKLQADFYLSG
jgi:hypothetical protein